MMTQRSVLVLKKTLLCQGCGTEFVGFAETPDEGFGYAALLYECTKCHAVFSHSTEDADYQGPPEKRIRGQSCPGCGALLDRCLERRSLVGVCPSCGGRNFDGVGQAEEAYMQAYQLYQ
jgi:hypothetical protein